MLGAVVCVQLSAQDNSQRKIQSEISNVTVSVHGGMSKDQIESQLITHESPAGFWIFLNEYISSSLGAPRKIFDPILFYNDIDHLNQYLKDRGYFRAVIDTTLHFSPDKKFVDIGISVRTNNRSVIDTLQYSGLDTSGIDHNALFKNAFIHQSSPFDKDLLVAEQNRLLHYLQTHGFPQAVVDSVSLTRYASTNNIAVYIEFNVGRRYTFGTELIPATDEDISPEIITRQLDYRKGDLFNEDKRFTSEQNLNRLGLFESATIRPLFEESIKDSNSYAVPMQFILRTNEFQEITPEFLVVNENNDLFSTGVGLAYKHRNFLGGARNFSISAQGRVNELEKTNFSGLLSNGLGEPTLYTKGSIESQWVFPYFFSNKTNAIVTLTTEGEKQRLYTLKTLRAKLSFATKFAAYTVGTTEFNVERIDPKIISASGLRVEDTTKQFNFIEAFTLQRDKTNKIFSPSSGFFHSVSIEEAGVVSRALGGFQLPYSEYYKLTFLLKHYLSMDDDPSNILALKFRGGFARLYNPQNQTPVPLPRRFFAGGSGSVRAWKDKQLSAFGDTLVGGNAAFEGSVEARVQLFPEGGKFLFFGLKNVWSVFFLDYGNTWATVDDIAIRDVAMAVGTGLRYETFVGPIRFDLAWRLYDPKEPVGKQWLYEKSFFKNSFALVQLGIGHAF